MKINEKYNIFDVSEQNENPNLCKSE